MKNKIIISIGTLLVFFFFACEEDDTTESNIAVEFSADVENIGASESVNFKDFSTGNISKWDWTFEGGTPPTSNLQNPSISYAAPGNYDVTLKVGYLDQSETLTKESLISVSAAAVTADFESSTTSALQNENVVFTDLSTGTPTSWNWEFISTNGTTITSEEQNPVIAFTEISTYSVKLVASNQDNSDEIVKEDLIEIIDATSISASFQASASNTYTGGTVSFTDTSVGTANTWSWTFEGGTPATSNAQNPTVTYDAPGRYNVSFTASNDVNSSEVTEEGFVVVVPGNGLAAYFPMNANSNDVGPNEIPTNLAQGSLDFATADRNMNENGSAFFDGSSVLLIEDNDAMDFGVGGFTIGFWFKTSVSDLMMVFQDGKVGASIRNQIWFRLNNGAANTLRGNVEDPNGARFTGVAGSELPALPSDDQWHYVTLVRGDGAPGSFKIYYDGMFVGERAGADALSDVSNDSPFNLGSRVDASDSGDTYSEFYTGAIDDLIFYNRALTQEEIAVLFEL